MGLGGQGAEVGDGFRLGPAEGFFPLPGAPVAAGDVVGLEEELPRHFAAPGDARFQAEAARRLRLPAPLEEPGGEGGDRFREKGPALGGRELGDDFPLQLVAGLGGFRGEGGLVQGEGRGGGGGAGAVQEGGEALGLFPVLRQAGPGAPAHGVEGDLAEAGLDLGRVEVVERRVAQVGDADEFAEGVVGNPVQQPVAEGGFFRRLLRGQDLFQRRAVAEAERGADVRGAPVGRGEVLRQLVLELEGVERLVPQGGDLAGGGAAAEIGGKRMRVGSGVWTTKWRTAGSASVPRKRDMASVLGEGSAEGERATVSCPRKESPGTSPPKARRSSAPGVARPWSRRVFRSGSGVMGQRVRPAAAAGVAGAERRASRRRERLSAERRRSPKRIGRVRRASGENSGRCR